MAESLRAAGCKLSFRRFSHINVTDDGCGFVIDWADDIAPIIGESRTYGPSGAGFTTKAEAEAMEVRLLHERFFKDGCVNNDREAELGVPTC